VRGTVSPIDIIPVAEDMGLIVDLGRWILRKACMECMKWPEASASPSTSRRSSSTSATC
jgi:EAL domain-containing protein (putative c-di-GMP-specific phosphodiesterase class I)